MDPVGPWTAAYAASYNRLAGAAAGGGGDFPHHLATTGAPATPPSTTSQLLLQAGAGPAFNPGGFLSPPPVGYDSVFTPFLHHANQKAHYTQALNAAQHRQAIANSKPSAESDVLRENYNSVHHQTLPPSPAFFEQAPATWSHQNNAQLPSPFGILPHESVVGSSPGGPGTKLTTAYENFNAAHFAAAQTLNHINSQLVAASYGDTTKRLVSRPTQSPPSKPTTAPNVTSNSSFFQQSPPGSYSRSDNPPSQFPTIKTQAVTLKSDYNTNTKAYSNANLSVSSQPTTTNSSVNLPQPQVRSASSAVYPPGIQDKQAVRSSVGFQSPTSKNPVNNSALSSKLAERRDSTHEPTQSSPISYAMIDSAQHRSAASRVGSIQQSQLQQQLLNHQKSSSYRVFPSSTGSTPESEYGQGTSHRNAPSTDGGYSSGSSVGQNGSDCNNLQRSPLNHSQQSPLGHVTSPAAYPMYHSPMTSMSSPSPVQQHSDQNGSYKQNPSPKVAPHSPLDASVPRPSSVGQVGYPTVITRNEQSYPGERGVEFTPKQCWEGAEHQLRNPGTKYLGYPGVDGVPSQHQRGILGLSERQQAYFDTPSQHLTETKGDPMSIVKNLQTLQQQCQAPVNPAPLIDVKPAVAIPKPPARGAGKRKKSVDVKTEIKNSEYIGRIPPPAHLNTNQPQQNGNYPEFERWSLPQSHKIYSGNSGSVSAQSAAHGNGNYVNPASIHPNQHTSSHSPYYQSLPSTSQQNCSEPQNCPETSSSEINHAETLPIGEPPVAKVIVPDVEEELGFLTETPKKNVKSVQEKVAKPALPEIKPIVPFSNPNSSFMASYIKFLQGEKETSPPPKRKLMKPTYIPVIKTESIDDKKPTKPKQKSPCSTPTLDFDNDPRYFPLPKDSSSRKLNTSSDSDCDELSLESRINRSKSRSKSGQWKTGLSKSSKRKNTTPSKKSKKRKKNSTDEEEEEEELQRRSSATRKAKEKISKLEDDNDFSGLSVSGSDQEWMPSENKEPQSDKPERRRSFRGKRRPPKVKKPPPSRFLESSDEETNAALASAMKESVAEMCAVCSSAFDDPKDSVKCCECEKSYHPGCCSLQTAQRLKKLGNKRSTWRCNSCRPPSPARSEKPSKKMSGPRKGRKVVNNEDVGEEYFPFKSGEFIVVKADLQEEFPPIWRVDGKTLLQKYEPFDQNGEKLYRNISTYSGWTPQNRDIYEKIPVQFIVQCRLETIVKFLRSEMVDPAEEQAFLEQSLSETAKYQDNFEVYIQTLISQALDSNFLAEIFAEKDEYFLQNVEVIDAVTEERRVQLVSTVDWPQDCSIQRAVATWPCYNVLADLKASNVRLCDACFRNKVHARIILYGQPYNATTLDGSTPHPTIINQKDFMICLDCIKWVQLYNKLVHQKYIMYIECAKRVAEKRSTNVVKDTTVILNELLADEDWLNKLFRQVRMTWADVEKAERERKRKLGIPLVTESLESKPPVTDVLEVSEEPITNVTAETKTPLTGVLAATEMSLTDVPNAAESSESLQPMDADHRGLEEVDEAPLAESSITPVTVAGEESMQETNGMKEEPSEAKSFEITGDDTDKIPKES